MTSLETKTEFSFPLKKHGEAMPLRPVKRASSKIIFLSMEGTVTEEEYFSLLCKSYPEVASKIQFISIQADILSKRPKQRTAEELSSLGKTQPWQLEEKLTQFKKQKENVYQFSAYPEDEFWLVMDVDEHWDNKYEVHDRKTNFELWRETIQDCKEKGYSYAVSNPFFENWLLLHHRAPIENDFQYAVTEDHPYEKTSYYRDQLTALGKQMKDGKHIQESDYPKERIKCAVERAKNLHKDNTDLEPAYYATTVYMLVDKILQLYQEMTHVIGDASY